jgi:hypothetical protein
MTPKVVSIQGYKKTKYIIVDSDTGDVLDDCDNDGYNSEYSANKVMWYKFKGGQDKIKHEKLSSDEFFKKHPEVKDFLYDFYEKNYYGTFPGESWFDVGVKEVRNRYNIIIPRYYLRYL